MRAKRREFMTKIGLASCAVGMGLTAGGNASVCAGENHVPLIGTNTYPWLTFARREGNKLQLHTPKLLAKIAGTGISGYEPIINDAGEINGLGDRLQEHSMVMPSIYVNSVLHDETKVADSIASVLAIAKAAKAVGTRIVVTNPSPIRWGSGEDKSDEQLRLQAKSLDRLGGELRRLGMQLAYHNHDAELRQGGREFHHMLTATDPANVKFCLDAHWVYRGCGNSEVAVFDALEHYHDRIVELHLRQSRGGIWTETFSGDGDIDYSRVFRYLADKDICPLMVLEQAVESESSLRLTVTQAHRESGDGLKKLLDSVYA